MNPNEDLSRAELLARLHSLLRDVTMTPFDQLCARGNYKADPTLLYPQTKGEYLADAISTLLASQSWIDPAQDTLLDEMLDISGSLDKDTDQPQQWQQLIALGRQLFAVA